jgi:hypothetical protein
MNILNYLAEATYNLGHIADEIYKHEIEPVIIRLKAGEIVKLRKVSIDDYIKELADKLSNGKYGDKYETVMNFRKTEKPAYQQISAPEVGKRTFEITLSLDNYGIKKLSLKQLKAELISSLSHELTHLFDNVRSEIKVKHPEAMPGTYNYYKAELETNSALHEIKIYARTNSKKWNQITSLVELRDAIMNINHDLEKLSNENPNGYKNIEKKLLKRLYRENLLPKDMVYKYDAY